MSSAMWQIPYYDFYCSIIITSCDLVDLYYIWKREDRIRDILPQSWIRRRGRIPHPSSTGGSWMPRNGKMPCRYCLKWSRCP